MTKSPLTCDFGWHAPSFSLPATEGNTYSHADVAGSKGTVVIFICNHCPYVLAALDRIIGDARELQKLGVGVVAINANDAVAYPADSFDKMVELANARNFPFPYLHDEDQSVARAYDAACTPDFFGFNANRGLQYRGRLDASRLNAGPTDFRRDLFEAMKLIAETGDGPKDQTASMGCSIKWKSA